MISKVVRKTVPLFLVGSVYATYEEAKAGGAKIKKKHNVESMVISR